MMQDLCIIVPMKRLAEAKSRLGERLSPIRRQHFAAAMLHRVLQVCLAVVKAKDICLVSADEELLVRADTAGLQAIRDPSTGGLNGALEAARRHAAAQGYIRGLVLPADLPRLTPHAITDLLAERGPALVPDRNGRGTNALLLDPLLNGELAFGTNSCRRHREIFGDSLRIVEHPLVALDVDVPEDIGAWLRAI